MPRIRMFIKGQGEDHDVRSPRLADEEIDAHLAQIEEAIQTANVLQLPWVRVEGANIVVAHRMEEG